MKKCIFLLTFFVISLESLAQSSTIAPNYIVIPGVASLPACGSTGKGRTVFNTTDNKMYFCDGTVWQGMAGVPSAGVGWSQTGADLTNTNTGVVKINSATGLATNAIFGSNGAGISLQKSNPTVGFNQYRDANNAQRYMSDGHAMSLLVSPYWGSMIWNINPSGFAGSLTSAETALMILSNNGRLGIGVGDDTPQEKLTIGTSPNNYGMLHTSGSISVGSYVSSIGGAIGTKTNHPFSLFANNSAAALTVKTNADIEISNGFYAAGTGSLNLAPLGVFKFSFSLNNDGDISDLSLTNIAGNILTGGSSYYKFEIVDDYARLNLGININAIPSVYTSIIVTGTPMCLNPSSWTNINANFYRLSSGYYTPNDDSRAAFINNGFTIQIVKDSFQNYEKFVGTFMVYGIK